MAAILKSSTFFSHPVEYLFIFLSDKMMCEMVIIFIPLLFKFKVILKVKQRISRSKMKKNHNLTLKMTLEVKFEVIKLLRASFSMQKYTLSYYIPFEKCLF